MNKEDPLKQICKMIASGEIPDEVYNKYLSKTPIGFMSKMDLYDFLKDKNKYKTKCTTISGYCGKNYEENLKRFRDKLKKNEGHIDGIVTIKSIVIYTEKVEEE